MTFNKINISEDCKCLVGAFQNPDMLFARRVNKEGLRDIDMRPIDEIGNKDTNTSDCEEHCGNKGISISEYIEGDDERIQAICQIMSLFPAYKPIAMVFSLQDEAGLIKHTPVESPPNEYHHDFYKSDTFTVAGHVNIVKAIDLRQYVQG